MIELKKVLSLTPEKEGVLLVRGKRREKRVAVMVTA